MMFNDDPWDRALDSGDARSCEHCGTRYWVDEWHHCEAGAEASRKASENFTKNYFGDGKVRHTRITIDVIAPATESALTSAVNWATSMESFDEPCLKQYSDDVLGWQYILKVEHTNE